MGHKKWSANGRLRVVTLASQRRRVAVDEITDKVLIEQCSDYFKKSVGERPYKCKYCKRAFLTSSHLKSHEVIHKGLKFYHIF